MIEAIQKLQFWMTEHNIPLEGVEVTIHFPNRRIQHAFTSAFRREVCLFTSTNLMENVYLETSLAGLKIQDTPVHFHFKVGDDYNR